MYILSLHQYTEQEFKEMSLIELTHIILTDKKEAMPFQAIVDEIMKLQGLTKEEIQQKLPQFYTDLNIDGRFSTSGENKWGLKDWYPIDQVEDEMTNPVKPKKKKAKKVIDLDDDFEVDMDDVEDFDEIEDIDDEEDLIDETGDLIDDEDIDDEDEEDLIEDDDFDIIEDEDEEDKL
ncbi:MAG: DNA-directed RNA polymerase subunit delta [Bacillus sp. (in: firmicutes)]